MATTTKKTRAPKRLTQQKFADMVGINYSSVSRIRRGHRNVSPEVLGDIVEAFDLNPTEALFAYTSGKEAFGQYLDETVFVPSQAPTESPPEN